jgi:NitT/TauT family transport system substrate-binding protein
MAEMRLPRRSMLKLSCACLGAFVVGCSRGGDGMSVTIGYASSAISLITAPWLVAYELGFFRELGIDLRWIVMNGGVNALQQTLGKRVDLTYPSANELLVKAKQQGHEPLPLKFFYLGIPRNIWQLAVLEESPIRTVADLRGKTVGIFANQAAYLPQIRALARDAGLDPAKDLQLRVVGVGAGALQALRTGQVQVSAQAEVQHAAFETMGARLRRLPLIPLVERLHGPGFLAHEDDLRDPERRAVMIKVARGMAMGTVFCEANPEAAVRLAWRAAPALRPAGDEAQALARSVHVLKAVLVDMALREEQNGQYGAYLPSGWEAYIELLRSGGEVTAPVDPASLYTNELIAEANRFDRDRVLAAARAAA